MLSYYSAKIGYQNIADFARMIGVEWVGLQHVAEVAAGALVVAVVVAAGGAAAAGGDVVVVAAAEDAVVVFANKQHCC